MPRVDHRLRVPPAISAEVVARYGNDCWLDMPGCTKVGDTSDHIVPHVFGGPTIVKNLRRACRHCNGLRRERILSGWPSVIHAVIGPPCAGKTTWALEHMQPGDIIVDYDRLADALMPDMPDDTPVPDAVRDLVAGAWQGAYRNAVTLAKPVSLWLVKVMPGTQRSPRLLDEWLALDYDIHVCDPGKPVVVERLEELKAGRRELASMRQWYRSGITRHRLKAEGEAREACEPWPTRRRTNHASRGLFAAGSGAASLVAARFLSRNAPPIPRAHRFLIPTNQIKKARKQGRNPRFRTDSLAN